MQIPLLHLIFGDPPALLNANADVIYGGPLRIERKRPKRSDGAVGAYNQSHLLENEQEGEDAFFCSIPCHARVPLQETIKMVV